MPTPPIGTIASASLHAGTPLRGRAIASATTAPTIAPPAWSPDQKAQRVTRGSIPRADATGASPAGGGFFYCRAAAPLHIARAATQCTREEGTHVFCPTEQCGSRPGGSFVSSHREQA